MIDPGMILVMTDASNKSSICCQHTSLKREAGAYVGRRTWLVISTLL